MLKRFLSKFIIVGGICACTLASNVNSAFANDIFAGEANGLAAYIIEETVSIGDQKYRSKIRIIETSTYDSEIVDVCVKMSGSGYVISFDNGPFEPIRPGSVDDDIRKAFQRIASNVGTAP